MKMSVLDIYEPNSFEKAQKCTFSEQEFLSPCILRQNRLLLVVKGTVRFTENGKSHAVNKGEYYILRKNFFYAGQPSGKASAFFLVEFQGHWAEQEPGVKQQGSFHQELIAAAEKLVAATDAGATYPEKAALFSAFVSLLPLSRPVPTTAQNIASYLEQHLPEPFSLETLSDHFEFSKNHIINLFKKEYDVTPLAYLQHIRLSEAKKMVEADTVSLAQVAATCGFPTYSHFYRSFHKAYHTSPEEWRLRKRK